MTRYLFNKLEPLHLKQLQIMIQLYGDMSFPYFNFLIKIPIESDKLIGRRYFPRAKAGQGGFQSRCVDWRDDHCNI